MDPRVFIPILAFMALIIFGIVLIMTLRSHRDRMSPREIQALGKTADEFDAGKQRSFGP